MKNGKKRLDFNMSIFTVHNWPSLPITSQTGSFMTASRRLSEAIDGGVLSWILQVRVHLAGIARQLNDRPVPFPAVPLFHS
jgi:hypothetical protein